MYLQAQTFEQSLAAAKPGETLIYHVGSLMYDRIQGLDFLAVAAVARAARTAYERGDCTLVQRRLGTNRFAYMAIKTGPGAARDAAQA